MFNQKITDMKIDKQDLVLNVDWDSEQISFEHCPSEGLGSFGVLELSCVSRRSGDGVTTPDETEIIIKKSWFGELTVCDENGELENYPKEYEEILHQTIIGYAY